MLKGIDISEFQPNINFDVLKTSADFVIARASFGNGYRDKLFIRNRDELRSRNIPHGFYHYSYPQYNSPENEANWFVNVAEPIEGELLCLDFEESWNGDAVDWCKRFLDTVSARLNGYKPLIYINLSMVRSHDWTPVINADYGLWLAQWDRNSEGAGSTTQWPVTAIRQYTDSEQIPGIAGLVDGDVFYGELDSFKAYGYHPYAVPVQPPLQPIPTVDPTPTPPIIVVPAQPMPEPPKPPKPPMPPVVPPPPPAGPPLLPPTFLQSLTSRKFILSVIGSAVAFFNTEFNIGLNPDQLMLVLLPLIAFIVVEGIADITERSKTP